MSRGTLLLLIASAVLAIGCWLASIHWRPVLPAIDAEFAKLAAEAERLRGNTDAERNTWKQRVDGLSHTTWTDASLDELAKSLGDDWRWDWQSADQAILRPTGLQVEKWSDYLDVVEILGRKPGVIVKSLEMRAAGSRHARQFTDVRFVVRFLRVEATTGDGTRAGPSPGTRPVASADSPATPRKVGPGPPLRPPAASAEPPADGPASAPSRPDPPGPWAGVSQPTSSIKPKIQ